MLETIDKYIQKPYIPFDAKFREYVCNVQDQSIITEVDAALSHIHDNLVGIDRELNKILEEY